MWAAVSPDPRDPDDAIRWFLDRVPFAKTALKALEKRVRRRAFVVAGVAQLDLVQQVKTALDKAVAKGTTFETFKAEVGQQLEAAWGKKSPRRLETVFQNNVMRAYGAGRARQMAEPAVLKGRPFRMLDAVLDEGTTDLCRRLDGLVLPADHPAWRRLTPPLHHGCRTGIRTLTRRQAERRTISTDPPEGLEAAPGFGQAPDLGDEWAPEPENYDPGLWDAYEEKTE